MLLWVLLWWFVLISYFCNVKTFVFYNTAIFFIILLCFITFLCCSMSCGGVCNVISAIFYLDISISFVMLNYCFIDTTIVLCLVILLLQSTHVIVGLAVLVCNNLILLCNVIMFVFINYHNVLFFIILYCLISL